MIQIEKGPVLTDWQKATATEQRNGSYFFEGLYTATGPFASHLKEGAKVVTDAGYRRKNQLFEIQKVVKVNHKTIEVYAEHVSMQTKRLALKPRVVINGNGLSALETWKSSLVGDHQFTVWSDIPGIKTTSWRYDKVQNARNALGGVEGSLLDVFGGEYEFDNYTIKLWQRRGKKSPTAILYGKNLTSLEQELAIDETYTSVYPYVTKEELIYTLDDFIVDSENVGKFTQRRIYPLDLSDKFREEDTVDLGKLREYAQQFIKNNRVGIPQVKMTVTYADLAKAGEGPLEEIDLCDTLPVVFEQMGVTESEAKVVETVWNCLTETYDKITLGSLTNSFKTMLTQDVMAKIDTVEKEAKESLSYFMANGVNKTYTGDTFPTAPIGGFKVGDWFIQNNGSGEQVSYVWTGNEWSKAFDKEAFDRKFQEVDNSLLELTEGFTQSDAKAQQALSKATDLETLTSQVQTQLDGAKTDLLGLTNWKTQTNNTLKTIADWKAQADPKLTKVLTDAQTALDKASQLGGRLDSVEPVLDELGRQMGTKLTQADLSGYVTTTQLTAKAGEISQEISRVEGLVPTQIGGRNYILNSDVYTTSGSKYFDLSQEFLDYAQGGKYVTISLDIKGDNLTPNDKGLSRIGCELRLNLSDGKVLYLQCQKIVSGTQPRERISVTKQIPVGTKVTGLNKVNMYVQVNGNPLAGRPKFELSSLPSDWSPAPEDVPTYTVVNEIKSTADKNTASIRDTQGNLTNLTQTVNTIQTTVEQTVLDPSTGKLAQLQTQLTQKAGELFSAISRVEGLVPTKVGTENLVPFRSINPGYNVQSTQDFTISAWAGVFLSTEEVKARFKAGETYTIRFEAELVERTTPPTLYELNVGFVFHNPSNPSLNTGFISRGVENLGDKIEFVRTFVMPQMADDIRLLVYTNRYTTNGASPIGYDKVRFTNFKISEGSVVTPWSPHPDDYPSYAIVNQIKSTADANTAKISDTQGNLNEVKQTVNGLNTDMVSVKDYVSKDGQRTTTYNQYVETKTAQALSTIRSEVSNGYVGKATLESTVSGINQTFSEIRGEIPTENGGRNYLLTSRTVGINSNNSTTYPISSEKLTEGTREFVRVRRTNLTSNPTVFSLYSILNKFSPNLPTSGKGKISLKARASTAVSMTMMGVYVRGGRTYNLPFENAIVQIGTDWTTIAFPIDFATIKDLNILRVNPLQIQAPVPDLSTFYLDLCEWQLELGNIVNDYSQAPEDVELNVTTKLAEYKQTVDGQFANLSTQYAGKTEFAKVQTTASLAEQIFGATNKDGALTNIAREVLAKDIFQTEISRLETNADLLARVADGVSLTSDPDFANGMNGVQVYANSNAGRISITREQNADGTTGQPTNTTSSRLKITHTGTADPYLGGVRHNPLATHYGPNKSIVVEISALLPVGYSLNLHSNGLGTDGYYKWLTPNQGTGKWERYVGLYQLGTGTINPYALAYISVSGPTPTTASPLVWYIQRFDIKDISNSVSQALSTRVTQLSDSYGVKVLNNRDKILSEIKLTDKLFYANVSTGLTYYPNLVAGTDYFPSVAGTNKRWSSVINGDYGQAGYHFFTNGFATEWTGIEIQFSNTTSEIQLRLTKPVKKVRVDLYKAQLTPLSTSGSSIQFKLGNGAYTTLPPLTGKVDSIHADVPSVTTPSDVLTVKITNLYWTLTTSTLMVSEAPSKQPWRDEQVRTEETTLLASAGEYLIRSDRVVLDADTIIRKAFINKLFVQEMEANFVKAFTGHFGNLVSESIDAKYLSADRAKFIQALFDGSDSVLTITGDKMVYTSKQMPLSVEFSSYGLSFISDGAKAGFLQTTAYQDNGQQLKGISWVAETDRKLHLGYRGAKSEAGFYNAIEIDGNTGATTVAVPLRAVTATSGLYLIPIRISDTNIATGICSEDGLSALTFESGQLYRYYRTSMSDQWNKTRLI